MISRIVPPGDRVSHGITIDQPSTTRGKKKLVGHLPLRFPPLYSFVFREGQERKKRKVDPISQLTVLFFFPTRVGIIIDLSVLP